MSWKNSWIHGNLSRPRKEKEFRTLLELDNSQLIILYQSSCTYGYHYWINVTNFQLIYWHFYISICQIYHMLIPLYIDYPIYNVDTEVLFVPGECINNDNYLVCISPWYSSDLFCFVFFWTFSSTSKNKKNVPW